MAAKDMVSRIHTNFFKTDFQTKMVTIYTNFQTETAQKPYSLLLYIAYTAEYPQ